MTYFVIGYRTKKDYDSYNSSTIDKGLTEEKAKEVAKKAFNTEYDVVTVVNLNGKVIEIFSEN